MTDEVEITALLNAANSGDALAQDAAYSLVYAELKRCAQRLRGAAPGSSLTPTTLVHELFLRLNQRKVGRIENRAHFFAGLSFKQIGAEIGRHERTVHHDWELARALLQESMGGALPM